MNHDGDNEDRHYNRRADDVHWPVMQEKIGRLEKDLDKIVTELENRYVLIIRFVPIERGFYWLVGLIVGAVILGILSFVIRK